MAAFACSWRLFGSSWRLLGSWGLLGPPWRAWGASGTDFGFPRGSPKQNRTKMLFEISFETAAGQKRTRLARWLVWGLQPHWIRPPSLPRLSLCRHAACWFRFDQKAVTSTALSKTQRLYRRYRLPKTPPTGPPPFGGLWCSFWPHVGPPGASFSSLLGVRFEARARSATQSKTLFEITGQKLLRDRCGPEAHKDAGSVAGLGAPAPPG